MAARLPTVRLRRLAAELRRLRKAAGLSQDDVTAQTRISPATLYRIEKPEVRPQQRTLISLLDAYGVTEPRRSEIIELAKEADKPGWLRPYHADLREQYTAYIAFETEAQTLCNYESLFIPGLLQTEDYARAVIEAVWPSPTPKDLEQHVQARMERQELLTKADPLRLAVVMDEAALRRQVGGPLVMAEQMRQLQAVAELPNVGLYVIPYSAGAHPGMPGSFVLMSFADPEDPALVYIEGMAGDAFLESEQDIDWYTTTFDALRALALSPDDSLSLIATVQHELAGREETS